MLNVRPAFLRRLDSEDVVQPARSQGGQRRYSQQQIYLVQRVIGLASEGLTLAGIKRLLVLEAEVKELNSQIMDLKKLNGVSLGDRSAATDGGAKLP